MIAHQAIIVVTQDTQGRWEAVLSSTNGHTPDLVGGKENVLRQLRGFADVLDYDQPAEIAPSWTWKDLAEILYKAMLDPAQHPVTASVLHAAREVALYESRKTQ